MLELAAINHDYARSDRARFAWHFGWYLYQKHHAARMRRVIDGDEDIAIACRQAAARNLRETRRILRARSQNADKSGGE